MGLDDLAAKLADRGRIGLTPELADKLKVRPADAMRGQLMAMVDGDLGPLGVYLLSVYVVDDTDFWGDGQIYWWSIPVLGDRAGKHRWGALSGLPAGAPPHKVGSLEWMTSFSLAEMPLLAVIPPDDDINTCTVRLAFYDDDGALADVPKAMTAGYETLSNCLSEGLSGAEQVITPVREAIWKSLRAEQDDILIDEDVTIRRGEKLRFNYGLVGSVINSMVRIYYLVKDELHTETVGPVALRKGQTESFQFKTPPVRGGRVAIFARGADVSTGVFGDLTTDVPFAGKVLDERQADALARGFTVTAAGPAKVIAFYTPPVEGLNAAEGPSLDDPSVYSDVAANQLKTSLGDPVPSLPSPPMVPAEFEPPLPPFPGCPLVQPPPVLLVTTTFAEEAAATHPDGPPPPPPPGPLTPPVAPDPPDPPGPA